MQINNFYLDPVPSVRNPLDSIVLSPHTVRPNEANLADVNQDFSDYRSILPSVCSCDYHGEDACRSQGWFARNIRGKFCRFIKNREL
jgi:hypothetical protein